MSSLLARVKLILLAMMLSLATALDFNSAAADDYLVYCKGETYHARNDATGKVEFSDPDAGKVLNRAIESFGDRGGSIGVASGTYLIGTTIHLHSNVTLYGRKGAVLKLSHDGNVVVGRGVQNVELTGLEIDGNKAEYSGIGVWFIRGSQHNVVSGLYVHDCKRDGIMFGNATTRHNRVVGNRVENCEGGGIALAASAGDSIVSENYVYRTRNHGIAITHGGRNCQIVNNKIVEAGHFAQPGDFCHGIAVDSNEGKQPHGHNNVITGNIIIDANMAGIEVADRQNFCVISNNTVENANSYGIYFGGGLAPSYNATIVGNIVKKAADCGIRVGSPYGQGDLTVNVTIGNNVVIDSKVDGIRLDTVGNVNVSNNISLNNGRNGIHVAGETLQLRAYRINIQGNQSYDNRKQKVQQYGLFIKNADHVTVSGNSLDGNKLGDVKEEVIPEK